VIYGREEFFNATKLMHNALQGAPQDLDEEQWATWRSYNEMNARASCPAGGTCASCTTRNRPPCSDWSREKAKGWVWRCHIDLSTPNTQTISELMPLHRRLSRVAVSHAPRTCRPE